MSHITSKNLRFILLMTVLFIVGIEVRIGYSQTSLQALQNRIAELEIKLADAKTREEKAQSIQTQLEEQEQKLVDLEKYLSESEKYRAQVVEIRMNINSIRAKIEAIVNEKNDLEQNLIIANNLQTIILRETQSTTSIGTKFSNNLDPAKMPYWQINNIIISDHFDSIERDEIMRIYSSGGRFNQDDFLKIAHQIFNKTGTAINFIVRKKNGNNADLEILLNQRTRITPTHPTSFSARNINEFKANYFGLKIE